MSESARLMSWSDWSLSWAATTARHYEPFLLANAAAYNRPQLVRQHRTSDHGARRLRHPRGGIVLLIPAGPGPGCRRLCVSVTHATIAYSSSWFADALGTLLGGVRHHSSHVAACLRQYESGLAYVHWQCQHPTSYDHPRYPDQAQTASSPCHSNRPASSASRAASSKPQQ